MKYLIFIILFSFLMVSCNSDHSVLSSDSDKFVMKISPDSITLNDTITIAFNDTVGSTTEDIKLSFDSLGTDSRCPVNVVCIWEGNAEVLFSFFNSEFNTKFKLNTHRSFTHYIVLYGFKIELIDLFPYPHTDSLYTDDDHYAKVIISKMGGPRQNSDFFSARH